MPRTLSQFSITQEADGYILHVEDDDGETIEYSATLEQLDEIVDAIDEQLEMDEDDPTALEDDDAPRPLGDEE